jgi:hypothetical protein
VLGEVLLDDDELALVVAAAAALTLLELALELLDTLDVVVLEVDATVVAIEVVAIVDEPVVVVPDVLVASTDALLLVLLRLLDEEVDDELVDVLAAWPSGAASAIGTAMAVPSTPANTARSTFPTRPFRVLHPGL